MGGKCGSILVWKNNGRVQLFRLAIALLVIAAENSMNADPAAHIPSCFRDRCEKIDLSSVGDGGEGRGSVLLSDVMSSYKSRLSKPIDAIFAQAVSMKRNWAEGG